MEAAFAEPGGPELKAGSTRPGNADYAALTYQGGAAWRERLERDAPATKPLLDARDDDALAALMTNLAGHDMASLVEAFDAARDDVPTLFIAYTIKGTACRSPGHKDNHSGLMNPGQIAAMRDGLGIVEGQEWEPLGGLGDNARAGVQALLDRCEIATAKRARPWGGVAVPAIAPPAGDEQSDPGRLSGRSGSIWQDGRPALRSHRDDVADVTVLDQSRCLGRTTRGLVPARRSWPKSLQRRESRRPEMGPATPAGRISNSCIAENNLVPDARRHRPCRRPVGRAAVPDRHRL
jgi:pyruvate dehydrogenase E1 component